MNTNFIKTVLMLTLLSTLFLTGNSHAKSQQSLLPDPLLINHERIEYWLKKRNQLSQNASAEQISSAIAHYIAQSQLARNQSRGLLIDNAKQQRFSTRMTKLAAPKIQVSRVAVAARVNEQSKQEVNVLALLIDFPDLLHSSNGLSAADTGMYYADYSPQHYQEVLFSETGFTGPDDYTGNNLLSVNQYFNKESGGSFSFIGQVFGWYTANNNASYYGAGNEFKIGELVLEAVNAAVVEGVVNLVDYDRQDPNDLDSDGILWEADGVIDHLIIFHSSIGEEAGGGVLGDDAIWSQRSVVGFNGPLQVNGSNVKVDGYTIVPIDAAAGVVAHEFGHDLGLDDEYDTLNSDVGSPVGNWSVMAAGTWLGAIAGTEPNSFSPLARDYLQTTFGGKWINQLSLDAANLSQAATEVELVEAVNHLGAINQIKLKLPAQAQPFKQPYAGNYQYYSGHKNQNTSSLSFSVTIPSNAPASLQMKAQWDIEQYYDYVQILANGVPLANSYMVNGIGDLSGKTNILTGASPANQWQTLVFDLSSYAGQFVSFEIKYVTDLFEGGYGFVVDNIEIVTTTSRVFFDGGEINGGEGNGAEVNGLSLNGFNKIQSSYLLVPQHYFIQLRSHNDLDSSLAGANYSPGVLMWLEDSNYFDNNVLTHPGHGFLAVIDGDQNLIAGGDSLIQVRDAAFGLYRQLNAPQDQHTDNNAKFDDSLDYSGSTRPETGVVLSPVDITMEVISQATDSSSATILLTRNDLVIPEPQSEPEQASADVAQPASKSGGAISFAALLTLMLMLKRRYLNDIQVT